jgi:uncharacterized membrane protein
MVSGESYDEGQGLFLKDLRPSLRKYIQQTEPDGDDSAFISFNALNSLLRDYINKLSEEDTKEQQSLKSKIGERFEEEDALQPINYDPSDKPMTLAERLADNIAAFGGSWTFILIFLSVLLVWMAVNVYIFRNKGFDPYPFILLNLALSCIAALQAPVIMMSQNRQAESDRERAEYDFKVNLKAETEVRLLHKKLDHLLAHQHRNMAELFQLQLDIMQQMQQHWGATQGGIDKK